MTRLLGIDFSGARDAGRRIWIAEGRLDAGRLRVEALTRAADLPDGGRAREAALSALRRLLTEAGDALVGLDVPNALPRDLLGGPWEPWATDFSQTHPTPDAFRAACRAQSGGREWRRECDRLAQTPFSPYNLRLYRQTWSYLAEVVAPLLADGAATVWPFQPCRPGRAHLLEICPASTLKRLGLYRSYKGRGAALRGTRDGILSALLALTAAALPPDLRQQALDDPGGDALDALIALFATAEAARDGSAERCDPKGEGDVYVWSGAERATLPREPLSLGERGGKRAERAPRVRAVGRCEHRESQRPHPDPLPEGEGEGR